jgi:lysophospholipase L1-like esterase
LAGKYATFVAAVWIALVPAWGSHQSAPDANELRFIDLEKNRIENGTASLKGFYDRLFELEERGQGKAVVLHLGDSHVEAGYLTGAVRTALQQEFGCAGLGWIIPKALVPGKRKGKFVRASLEKPQPFSVAEFHIGLKDDDPSPGFTRMVFFHNKGAEYQDFQVLDTSKRLLGIARSSLDQGPENVTIVDLPVVARDVVVRTLKTNKSQRLVQLSGISLEGEGPGVIYHSWGINGATTDTFNRSVILPRLLAVTRPDLVIVSLGTNDAFGKGFKEEIFATSLLALVAEIQTSCPDAAVLISTPSDSFYRRTRRAKPVVNPMVGVVRSTILRLGPSANGSTWDLFSVMGSAGSIKIWQKNALAGADLIHFTKEGYQLQGRLFFAALMDGYRNYAKVRSR